MNVNRCTIVGSPVREGEPITDIWISWRPWDCCRVENIWAKIFGLALLLAMLALA